MPCPRPAAVVHYVPAGEDSPWLEIGHDAVDHDRVWGIPPWPWPATTGATDYSAPATGQCGIGPIGTVWRVPSSALDSPYTLSDLRSLESWLRGLWKSPWWQQVLTLSGDSEASFTYTVGQAEDAPVTDYPVVRAVVHAKLGTLEELQHVLHFRLHTGADTMPDLAALTTFGGQIATAWQAFFQATDSGSPRVHPYFSDQLVYDEVRMAVVAYKQMTSPAPHPNPAFIIPTQYVAFPTGVQGSDNSNPALPYEVALCLTHLTSARGRSNKGRVYLGGLSTHALSTTQPGGIFTDAAVYGIAHAYWNMLVSLGSTSSYDLQVVSARSHVGNAGPKHPGGEGAWAAPTSRGVAGIRVGVVPDAQRRRRRSQQELYTVAGGTAP